MATLQALSASADRIARLLTELGDERARRNEMVVQLVDEGTPRREVSRAARISPKSICVCLATAGGAPIAEDAAAT